MLRINTALSSHLNPYAYRSYTSLIRKSANIERHLVIINETLSNLHSNIPLVSQTDSDLLVSALSDFCENIYSSMDYLSQVIRQEFKKFRRGVELSDGFNSILSEVKKEKKEIYKDEVIKNLILPAAIWYEGIHMIRTEETHYGMGQVMFDEGVFKYQNQNRRGEPPTIIFEFRIANNIFESYISYIRHVESNLIFLNKAL
jgi:hypothetical protein